MNIDTPGKSFGNAEGGSVEQHIDERLKLHHCLNYAAVMTVFDSVGKRLDLFEAGCGSGMLSHAMSRVMPSGWRLTATDYDPALVEAASVRYGHPRLDFREVDLLTATEEDLQPCDGLMLLEVIEHFHPGQAAMLLAKFHATMPPGARLVMSTLDRSGFQRRFSGYPAHAFEYDRRSFIRLLSNPALNPFRQYRLLRLISPRMLNESIRAEERGGYVVNRLNGLARYLASRFSLFRLALTGLMTVGCRLLQLVDSCRFRHLDLDEYLPTVSLREDPDGRFDKVSFGLVVELIR